MSRDLVPMIILQYGMKVLELKLVSHQPKDFKSYIHPMMIILSLYKFLDSISRIYHYKIMVAMFPRLTVLYQQDMMKMTGDSH